ncbi:MAG: hypothetical protein Q8K60_05795, partial [Parachlamydiaceae bacterium]|nr:hypothetical protein [Parachlamydiaceae bacterium]
MKEYLISPSKFTNALYFERKNTPFKTDCTTTSIMLKVLLLVIITTGVILWTAKLIIKNNSQHKKIRSIVDKKISTVNTKEQNTSLETINKALKDKNIPDIASDTKEINAACFLKKIPAQYKYPKAPIRLNLEALIKTNSLDTYYFLGMRGDGDCAFRTIAIGILFETFRKKSINIVNVTDEIKNKIDVKQNIPPKFIDEFLNTYKNFHEQLVS